MEHYLNLAVKSIFIENLALAFFLGISPDGSTTSSSSASPAASTISPIFPGTRSPFRCTAITAAS